MLDIQTRWSRSHAQFSTPLPPEAAKARLVAAAEAMRSLRIRYETTLSIVLMSSANWRTWGDLVTVEFHPEDDGGTRVSVRAAPVVPITFFNWGQGAKDIRLVYDALVGPVR
ncbi:hypothetical protein [Curtobacterium sp. ISL-83]|uniref:hypothetical protein n=1 Tax=Curtobacterium sp. ISL-83 TaxID=2819145 RepID=UPI001BECA552|nr:hypothetical protein [Curtobacterium sp. ISL-83]MBT2504233.1 hypothetical protein [Curtobacterium sp. ISL-83]